jgi:K+-transporting ATPase ATPase C chain
MRIDNGPTNTNHGTTHPASQAPGVAIQMLAHVRISIIATIVLALIVCGVYPAIVWGLAQAIFHHQANGSLIKKDGTPTDNDAEAVGSALLGQPFADAKYFHPRPSAAGNGYDATSTGGTNLGPLSAKLMNGTTKPATPAPAPVTQPTIVVDFDGIKLRVLHYCDDNSIPFELTRDAKPADPKSFKTDAGWDEVKLILAFNDADHPLMIKAAQPIPPDAVTASASGLDPHISVANANFQAHRVADVRKVPVDRVKALIGQFTEGRDWGVFGDPGVNVLKLNIALENGR